MQGPRTRLCRSRTCGTAACQIKVVNKLRRWLSARSVLVFLLRAFAPEHMVPALIRDRTHEAELVRNVYAEKLVYKCVEGDSDVRKASSTSAALHSDVPQ